MIETINNLIIETTKKRDTQLLGVYKLVKAEFQRASKSGKNWDPIDILLGMITTREDSVTQYTQAGRQDLADEERYEIEVIKSLLPPLPGETEMKEAIEDEIKALGRPPKMGDIKAILGKLKSEYPGMNGKLVSEIIKSHVGDS